LGEQSEEIYSRRFASRFLLVCLVGAAMLGVWKLSDVLVLAFGAARLALLLRGLAHEVSRRTGLSGAWAVLPVVLAMAGSVVAVGWLFGAQIAAQFGVLAKDLPQSISQVVSEFQSSSWGAWLLGRAKDVNIGSATGQAAGYVAVLFGSVLVSVREDVESDESFVIQERLPDSEGSRQCGPPKTAPAMTAVGCVTRAISPIKNGR
jgi:predicted PurR-regulated permease PerM